MVLQIPQENSPKVYGLTAAQLIHSYFLCKISVTVEEGFHFPALLCKIKVSQHRCL